MLCIAALGLTIVPAYLEYSSGLASSTVKGLMLVGTAVWFVAATALAVLREKQGGR